MAPPEESASLPGIRGRRAHDLASAMCPLRHVCSGNSYTAFGLRGKQVRPACFSCSHRPPGDVCSQYTLALLRTMLFSKDHLEV